MKQNIIGKFSLQGKVAVISGTTRGIGQALAEALIESGADVIALDRSENDYLEMFSKDHDGTFKRNIVDLLKADQKAVDQLIDSVVQDYKKIDILVNNAGITRRGEVYEFEKDDWDDVMHVNLSVPFFLSKAAARYFVEQKSGKIINMASMLSYQGGVRVPSYASSKHGIVGLTKSFANGLAKFGINVNAIAPGFIKTDLTQPLQDDPDRNASIIQRIPAGRWGECDDMKGALIFLASEMSDYLQGIVLPVDGGWLSS